jgi:hypothetical protein
VTPEPEALPVVEASVPEQVAALSAPTPVAPEPEPVLSKTPEPTAKKQEEPVTPPTRITETAIAVRAPVVKPAKAEPLPADISTLPVLRSSDRAKHNLEYLEINMLREAGEAYPYAKAIINLNSLFVGDRIPQTQAKVVAIELRGIAIEMIGSKERYYIPN